jgi:hypothetical protein
VSLLQAAGNGYLKSSYEGEKCIEVVYIDLSAGWVLSRAAGCLIGRGTSAAGLQHARFTAALIFVYTFIFHQTFKLLLTTGSFMNIDLFINRFYSQLQGFFPWGGSLEATRS